MESIKPGLVGEASVQVTPELSARHLGSGGVEVYATPSMIALMETAAVKAVDPLLPEGQATVGVSVEIKHLAATPAGQTVRARAEVMGVEGRRVHFVVQAWDEDELIGEGTHTRYVIDMARFLERVEAKRYR